MIFAACFAFRVLMDARADGLDDEIRKAQAARLQEEGKLVRNLPFSPKLVHILASRFFFGFRPTRICFAASSSVSGPLFFRI